MADVSHGANSHINTLVVDTDRFKGHYLLWICMANEQNHNPPPETPAEHVEPDRDGPPDPSDVRFAVRRFRDADDFLSVVDIDIATVFAESNNTLRLDRLRRRLHPKVVYESDWAGVSMTGRRRVMRWLRRKYGPAGHGGGYRSQVIVLTDGRAGVLTEIKGTRLQAVTTFTVVDGRATRINVSARFERQSLRETLYYPPEA